MQQLQIPNEDYWGCLTIKIALEPACLSACNWSVCLILWHTSLSTPVFINLCKLMKLSCSGYIWFVVPFGVKVMGGIWYLDANAFEICLPQLGMLLTHHDLILHFGVSAAAEWWRSFCCARAPCLILVCVSVFDVVVKLDCKLCKDLTSVSTVLHTSYVESC